MEIIETTEETERPKRESTAKYPHSKEVFKLWGKYPAFWNLNAGFCASAEWLYTEKGIEELSDLMKWYPKHKEDKFCPKFRNPKELAEKYGKLEDYFDRHA